MITMVFRSYWRRTYNICMNMYLSSYYLAKKALSFCLGKRYNGVVTHFINKLRRESYVRKVF